MNLGETLTLEDIPSTVRNEADALQMLAWSRHRHGDKVGAAQAALQALDAATPSFFTRETALSLCLDQAAGDGVALQEATTQAQGEKLSEAAIATSASDAANNPFR